MATKKSSSTWISNHLRDPFVKLSQKDGYRSRAVYKLIELQEKYQFIKQSSFVLDLGAAPGSWSQYAANIVSKTGKVVACDKLLMEVIDGVNFIQGDFEDNKIFDTLSELGPFDVIISDMAPNMTGMKRVDQLQSIGLVELVVDVSKSILNLEGAILFKVFQGPGFDEMYRDIKRYFKQVYIKKPKASRKSSMEIYLLAMGYGGRI